ncbi:hypothetical protein PHYSODRAFT_336037 [Phytophthora sojae]|uniref:Peptidase A2 domain-containing protein n=1 Tax=Phytophthora sojae (strain P6497) TaxID=1094619 RepID=G4ZVP9_PHYSP|nr:hypothetical protein PHYSODRAFT_336037 [Phytophthora sojae]EGZ11513.1 hypothetical protein PHYSODRAFT_336037 [Phytophthora sojae]|eukprot:XP_009531846.1 hypothetical protein PHYSODRAFT_336037 [Phytophthora sojae]
MSTAADSKETKTGVEKSESSLRRSLRVAGLPAVVPTETGTSRARRSTAGARTPSAEGEAASSGETTPSAEPEVPLTTETAVPPPSSPEKKNEDEQGGGAGTQPSARVGESPSLGEPAVSRALTPRRTSEAATATSQPQGVNPKPTAADLRSGQAEGGALSMLAYGRTQFEMWMSVPAGVVHLVDGAYSPCHGGYDLWGFIRVAGATARNLVSVTRSPAARWLNVFHAERRRIPATMLHEAGYEFLNQVPVWHTLSEVAGVPDSQIRFEIERIARFLGAEPSAWKAAVGSTPYYLRPTSDSQLMAAQAAETQVGFPLDQDGDAIMDEDTQLFLGPEVVMRLQLTGLRPRSPTSSVEGEPSRKRALLTRSSGSGSIPSYHESGEAPAETALGFRNDRVRSMVGASSGSDMSLMVTDEGGNLFGISSSGSSLMSMTDYMVGTGTHMPMSTATVMRGSATTMSRSSFPGMKISVTPQLTQAGPIPLPGSPESKRSAPKQAETRQSSETTGEPFSRAEQARLQEEYRKLQATNVRMSEAQQQAKTEQQKQLEALEKLAQRRAAEEAEKPKADERKAQEERAVEFKTEHERELLRLKEKHAQAEAEHQWVMQEQEEKTCQLLAAQEQPGLYPGPVSSTAGRLTSVMQQLLQANQNKSEVTGMSHSAGKIQGSAKRAETKSKSRASSATSGAKGKARATKPGRPGDSDGDDSGSDDSSSSDSSQDELEGQFGAVAQPKGTDTSSGTRVVAQAMIPHDALEKFDQKGPLEDRVNWWERFMHYATMAPWDEKTRVVQLRMRLTGSLKDWRTQLTDDVRSDWKKLSHVFKKEWCRTLSSKAERYYSMEMKDSDTPRMFFYRLNHVTKKAGIPYRGPTAEDYSSGKRFDTLDELEKTLKRIEDLRQDESYEQKRRPAQGLQFGRFKPPQPRAEGRAFKAEGVEVDPSLGRHAHFQDDYDLKYEADSAEDVDRSAERTVSSPVPAPAPAAASSAQAEPSRSTSLTNEEIFRVAEKLAWKPNAQCYDRGGDQHPEQKCDECGSRNHPTDKCWSRLICGRCHDEGHPTQFCRRQTCSKCGEYHRRGLCDMWSALKAVREAIRTGGSVEGLAPEVIQALLDNPELREKDNPECATSYHEAGVYTFDPDLNTLDPEDEMENHLEFALTPGEKYGWWSEHTLPGEMRKMAMVHGAIFHHRTQILLDTGTTTSILGLDLARRLKLKLRRGFRLRVTGMGDAPTYITAQAKIKLTLGVRVVYVMDVWVGNIGEGVDCLLGMDFMVAAGVRLCARQGIVRLPDEESLLLVGGPEIDHVGLEGSVWLNETAYLYPGQSVIVPVKYHQTDPEKVIPWAGCGDQWVTQFIYGPGRRPKAVKVVNISEREVMIRQHTVVACLVEKGYLPNGKRFARPYSWKYSEWAQLIYEAEPSPDFLRQEEEAARLAELNAPPAVERPVYKRPMKLLLLKQLRRGG